MTAASVEPETWSKRHWWLVVAFVFLTQVALIFALSGREPAPRPASPGFTVTFSGSDDSGLAELLNPTVFALPSYHGFSSAVWLEVPAVIAPVLERTPDPHYLPMQTNRLGTALAAFVRAKADRPPELMRSVEPQLDSVGIYPVLNLAPTQSTVRITGELAGRPLLSKLPLESRTASDVILTNSRVQVEVASDGRVFTAELLNATVTGDQGKADRAALNLARAARFQPLRSAAREAVFPDGGLMRGVLEFQWLTVAQPGTNAPPAGGP